MHPLQHPAAKEAMMAGRDGENHLRILILNHNLRGRGTWHRAWQFARELARRGHDATVWSAAPHHYYRPAGERADQVGIIETPSWSPFTGSDEGWGPLDAGYRSLKVLFGKKFDLYYAFAHPPNVFLPAWIAKKLLHRPLIYDWCDWYEGGIFPKRNAMRQQGLTGKHEPWLQQRTERWEIALERAMPRLADRVTVISRKLQDLALAAGRREEEILLLPNGANLDTITPRDLHECRRALAIDERGPYFGYVANYHPDQELLLRALARAVEKYPALKLLKTGPPFAEGLMRELGLAAHIVDFGFVLEEKIPVILGASDALLLPLEDNDSNRARVPFKFTDYLAAGRPVVTNRVGDLTEHFPQENEVCDLGIATTPELEAFAEGMTKILAPECRRVEIGENARRFAEVNYSWALLTDQLEGFIRRWLFVKDND